MYTQLSINVFQVKINRILADGQQPRNALVAQTQRDQAKDLFFPPRQCHRTTRRGILVWASLVGHGVYALGHRPNSIALKIIASALAEP